MGPTSTTATPTGEPTKSDAPEHKLKYHYGFGNAFRSESIPDCLPKLGHNPSDPPYGLYTEGLTGSAFTAPRNKNRRTWFYRVRPSVCHTAYAPYNGNTGIVSAFTDLSSPLLAVTPQQFRWDPFVVKGAAGLDFVDGIRTIAGTGDATTKNGCAIHFYSFGKDMDRRAMYNADGDLLFLPIKGELLITTEFGKMHVPPNHLAVVQRSMKFSVARVGEHGGTEPAEGYLVETYKGHFELPELGPIGGNGLANIEDFETLTAWYHDVDEEWSVVAKYQGQLWQFTQDHSPYVVGWMDELMSNYVPFRYDMFKMQALGSVSYDHSDPSLSCCLTVPSDTPGVAVLDFLAFGPRWSAVAGTFRPQWFHRNICAEFMISISGYPSPRDGCNLHNVSSAHGPGKDVTKASIGPNAPTGPMYVGANSMVTMVETFCPLNTTRWAVEGGAVQAGYMEAMWQNIERNTSLPPTNDAA